VVGLVLRVVFSGKLRCGQRPHSRSISIGRTGCRCCSSPSGRITSCRQGRPPHGGEVRRRRLDHRAEGFPGRPHFPSVPGWEEVADYALTWTLDHALTSVSGHSADAQMKPVKATGTPSMLRPQRPCADQRTGDLADPTPNRISRQSERGRLRGQRADTRWLVFAAKAVDHKMSHHSRGGGRGANRNRGG
jgi:hypothetical protein